MKHHSHNSLEDLAVLHELNSFDAWQDKQFTPVHKSRPKPYNTDSNYILGYVFLFLAFGLLFFWSMIDHAMRQAFQ